MDAVAIERDDPSRSVRPVLSAGEEEVLCYRWHQHHDVAAARLLISSHLPLVAGIAMAHRGRGVLIMDLIGEGYVALMRAACHYDPACGAKFTTYATRWVQVAIQQSILRAATSMQAGTANAETSVATSPLYARGCKRCASVRFVP